MKRTAITGGIAMGKSTVLSIIADRGYSIASADEIAINVLADSEIRNRIAERVGIGKDFDNRELREEISSDPVSRRAVNSITHPAIVESMMASEAEFIEVPLLIESCLYAQFDRIWVVSCSQKEQLKRLEFRLKSSAHAAHMIQTQLQIDIKEVFADAVIRTNSGISTVRDHIGKLLESDDAV